MLVSLEILDDVKEELESSTEDVTSVLKEGNPEPVQATSPLRPWRQAARAGEERRRLPTNADWIKYKVMFRTLNDSGPE